ncbi:MAG TPA: NAD(+) synthase [Casimicrobiaceae bacterium]|nr:NAD(+) synthase [Casimicrobiaceae bacterium]
MAAESFFNLYRHGFARIAVAVPTLRVADPAYNAERTVELLQQAAQRRAVMAVFPELGLCAYTSDDLFQQQALLDASQAALQRVLDASRGLSVMAVVGLPLRVDDLLFNCAVVLHDGHVLGVVPKSYIPNYREFYELRWFAPGRNARFDRVDLAGQRDVPFGPDLLFRVASQPMLTFHVEICEDLWVPIPPSSFAAMAGATVLLNLSASNITVGKGDYRRELVGNQSARCMAGYAYSAAGIGESTTDLAWDGHGLIYENGNRLAESERFKDGSQLIVGDIDLDRLVQERSRQTSFGQCAEAFRDHVTAFRMLTVDVDVPRDGTLLLERAYERFPYVPANPATREARCREIFDIQVQGLVTRMRFTGSRKAVIGVSGGLDSTHALLVCIKAMELMGRPRTDILGVTMPGFATSERSQSQAERLLAALGCEAMTIDIRPSCMQMLKDLGHPYAAGQPVYDVTFENVQAGERTSHLFRLANFHRGLVVGTGDLSEFALGWCTYGVGDQMSHYGVNASVPKTLIQHLIRWVAESGALGPGIAGVLTDVLGTTISPELVPGEAKDKPSQSSEAAVGPYELQDFHLYYTLRFGYRPSKVAFLAWSAWHDVTQGYWPGIVEADRHAYDIGAIKRWLAVFLKRFFHDSQFKRSAMPNAPKVGSGGSLSPRGDYRAPSDAHATAWLAELETVPEKFSGFTQTS